MPRSNEGLGIPAPRLGIATRPLRFSFKYLDTTHRKFAVTNCDVGFLRSLLAALRKFSDWRVEDFMEQNNREHRHIIDFAASSEKDGFVRAPEINKDQLWHHEPWQLGIPPDQRGSRWRIHGILLDDTFFIVWLDPKHALFPDPN